MNPKNRLLYYKQHKNWISSAIYPDANASLCYFLCKEATDLAVGICVEQVKGNCPFSTLSTVAAPAHQRTDGWQVTLESMTSFILCSTQQECWFEITLHFFPGSVKFNQVCVTLTVEIFFFSRVSPVLRINLFVWMGTVFVTWAVGHLHITGDRWSGKDGDLNFFFF